MTDPQKWNELQKSRYSWPRLREASRTSGIPRKRLRLLLKAEEIVGIQRGLGRYWHVDPASLAQWLAGHPQQGG